MTSPMTHLPSVARLLVRPGCHRLLMAPVSTSTAVPAQNPKTPQNCHPDLDLTFTDFREAFKTKRTSELARALLVFNLCSCDLLVNKPKEVMRFSQRLLGKRLFEKLMKLTFYGQFVAGENQQTIKPLILRNRTFGVKAILDYSAEQDLSEKEAKEKVKSESFMSDKTRYHERQLQYDLHMFNFLRCIDAVSDSTRKEGMTAIKLTALGPPELLERYSKQNSEPPLLSDEEQEELRKMLHRTDTIVKHAIDTGVRVMIDAEQSYFQPAIRRITMELMRKYNKERNVVFNTYQCYLKSALEMARTDLNLAEQENFYFGAKLVRGAYMDQERERARERNYEDPINSTPEATSDMYHSVLDEVFRAISRRDKGKIAVMVASHNEDTVRLTVKKMKENGVCPSDGIICFGQLLGMSDHVSFPLGQAGYSVYKYVPFGDVKDVLPYLGRRACENRALLAKVQKEKRLLRGELKRRLLGGQLFYQPD